MTPAIAGPRGNRPDAHKLSCMYTSATFMLSAAPMRANENTMRAISARSRRRRADARHSQRTTQLSDGPTDYDLRRHTITRVLAKELGPKKIRVNAINPGGSDFEKQMVSRTALGRLGQPDDIAPVAVFLASAASGWMTGETIAVGGGFS
jgi:hypothetical protein